ncbi:mRNA turnover protein 4 homolog [Paramacrobiotus metropolitanus]|uniref:mRNA turnover protein 4 homolog n=1 Tax=Paramacrobiotus metropolitanus TaxID=2943436 RepID=UPI002445F57F|nr:mRNA turnover protein 4 homolog [Paramacrobiotus metropolitanus]
MPKSKRNREVPLTKTKSKGKEEKSSLISEVRRSIEDFKYIYVFEIRNPRNNLIKDVREDWKDSKFFMGKNNLLQIALGRDVADEQAPGLAKLSAQLQGQRGLLLTSRRKDETLAFFRSHKIKEYARSGFRATETVVLDAGPQKQFSHAIEPHLRQLGLPTVLDKGVVTLSKDFTVCTEGDILTPEQCKILKLFELPMASFGFRLQYLWTKKTGKLKKLSAREVKKSDDTDDKMGDE